MVYIFLPKTKGISPYKKVIYATKIDRAYLMHL